MRTVRVSHADEEAGSHRETSTLAVVREDTDDDWEELPDEMSALEVALAG